MNKKKEAREKKEVIYITFIPSLIFFLYFSHLEKRRNPYIGFQFRNVSIAVIRNSIQIRIIRDKICKSDSIWPKDVICITIVVTKVCKLGTS